MTQRTSRASSTVARALQMTAARAMSRGLEATEGRGTRFTRPLPAHTRRRRRRRRRRRKGERGVSPVRLY